MPAFSVCYVLCFAFILVCQPKISIAQNLPKSLVKPKFVPKNISWHAAALSADSINNCRELGQATKMMANYIASEFEKIGLTPLPKSTYNQKFTLRQSHWSDIWLEINNKRKVFLQDFYALGHFNIDKIQEQETVLLGFAIDDERYSDYRAVEVTNRAAIIFMGEPVDMAGNSLISGSKTPSDWANNWQKKVATARDFGAKTCFVVPFRTDKEFFDHIQTIRPQLEKPAFSLELAPAQKDGIFFIPPSMAAEMMAMELKEILRIYEPTQAENATSGKRQKRQIGIPAQINEIRFRAERVSKKIGVQNVLGYLEGSDKKDEFVIVACSYNFSATTVPKANQTDIAAMLEISRLMALAAKNGHKPARSIVFAAFMDTENNKLGSRYYVSNPIVPLEKTMASLHLEQIERIDSLGLAQKSAPIYVVAAENISDQIKKIVEQTNRQGINLDLAFVPENSKNLPYQSGYYSFVSKNIPSLAWFSGMGSWNQNNANINHQINIARIVSVSTLALQTTWQFAAFPTKLELKPIKSSEKQDKF